MSTTPNYTLGIPDEDNTVADEFYRLQTTIGQLDTLIKALNTAVSGKAESSHTHAMNQITGLVAALAAKQDAGQAFSLDDLSDVSGASAAANGYILVKTALGFVAQSALSALGTHGHAIGDISGLADVLTLKATLASPALTGNPTAPTQASGNNSTRLATTAFVTAGFAALIGGVIDNAHLPQRLRVVTGASSTGSVNDYVTQGSFWLNSGVADKPFSGAGILSVVAGSTTAVTQEIMSVTTGEVFSRTGTTWTAWRQTGFLQSAFDAKADAAATTAALALKAALASPAFTGNPTAPTQASGNNSTRLATTAFVQSALSGIESGIGYGQAWETVSRTSGTSYQNTTGKPIMVCARITRHASTVNSLNCYVGTATAPTQIAASAALVGGAATEDAQSVTFVVPPSSFYRIMAYSGLTVQELR